MCNLQWDVPDSYDVDDPVAVDRYYRLSGKYQDCKEDLLEQWNRLVPLVEADRLRIKLADQEALKDYEFLTKQLKYLR